jgi:hypothetical protein
MTSGCNTDDGHCVLLEPESGSDGSRASPIGPLPKVITDDRDRCVGAFFSGQKEAPNPGGAQQLVVGTPV